MKPLLHKLIVLSTLIVVGVNTNAQIYSNDEPFAHTFSIVAQDPVTGEMAVGVQSHWFSVGTIVSWAKSGVGVVATQSFVNPAFGPDGLKLMSEGKSAEEVINILIKADEGRDYRQLAILNANGNVFAYTGNKCVASANHKIGDYYSVQANMMLNDDVVPAMTKAFEDNFELPLAERIVKVLQAAQNAGGDIRGRQSAVLLVVSGKSVEHEWMDKKVDLRVDDHPNPLSELERLLKVHRAYEHMNNGDLAIEHGDMELALKEYAAAEGMFPDNLEMKYWKAVSLANNGRLKDALPIFEHVFKLDKNWIELTKRLPKSGLLSVSNEDLDKILKL